MIKHIVCFKLENPTLEACQKAKEVLLSMRGNVPMLVDLAVGIDFLHSARSYDIILETYFKTKEDLDAYQIDPYHCSVVKNHMHAIAKASVAIDYEIDDFKYEIKDHKIGVDFWNSKQELFEAYFGAFYDFILSRGGKEDLESHNIYSKEDFYKYLADNLPESPWYYPEEQISDMPLKLLAAEIVREKLFLFLHQELPYSLTVEPELWERREDGSVRAEITIYVERENQKIIVLGKGGSMIKRIGQTARREIEELLEDRVHLFLFVKVRENWQEDAGRYSVWGLDFKA